MEVEECHRHVDRLSGEGHVVARLEGFVHVARLLLGFPFLEERGEGVGEKQLLGFMVAQHDFSVAAQEGLGEACLAACPSWRAVGMLKEDVLRVGIASKNVVQPQGAVGEPFIKQLTLCTREGAKG